MPSWWIQWLRPTFHWHAFSTTLSETRAERRNLVLLIVDRVKPRIRNTAMPLLISDALLESAGLSETEAKLEIACRLYDAERLSLAEAMRWAGVDRTALEEGLLERGLPIYRVTAADLADDAATCRLLGST